MKDLILAEVNVKEIALLEDASGVLVKQIKPNFKALGPRFGRDMKLISNAVNAFTPEDINIIEQKGSIDIEINGKIINLGREDVEIKSQDIEGWLVANEGSLTVALDVTITDDLRQEGIARELVNRIQNLRKDSGFEVTDRISVQLQQHEDIAKAVKNNLEYIKAETSFLKVTEINKNNFGINSPNYATSPLETPERRQIRLLCTTNTAGCW